MRVLAIDPGGTTGLAIWRSPDTACPGWEAWAEPWEEAQDTVASFIEDNYLGLVVCESFHITANTGKKSRDGSMQAIEFIGLARFLTRRAGIEFVTQSPSEAKTWSNDEKLKAMGWWSPSDHARDASRHLLLALAKRRLIDLKDLIT